MSPTQKLFGPTSSTTFMKEVLSFEVCILVKISISSLNPKMGVFDGFGNLMNLSVVELNLTLD